MQSLSIVIICKDEADVIGNTLQSLQGITDDIVSVWITAVPTLLWKL
jgi:hypothetical protein